MVGDELPLTAMTSTPMTRKASATTGTYRARYRERLAGGVIQVIQKNGRPLDFLGAEISQAAARVGVRSEG